MQWWFIKVRENENMIEYSYARKTKECDGRIIYSKKEKRAVLAQPSLTDFGNETLESQSMSHFYGQVVDEGFPEETHVCCG